MGTLVENDLNQINDFIDQAITLLDADRRKYELCANKIQDFLESKISDKNIIVQTRVKSGTSLREKIYRKNYFHKYNFNHEELIKELPDLIGVRILCLLNDEEKIFFDQISTWMNLDDSDKWFFIDTENGDKFKLILNDQPKPQKNGHDMYRIDGKWIDKENDFEVNVELQIKSMVHFFWGEMEHKLFYKNYECIIADSYYAQEMKNINCDLEMIDRRLCNMKIQFNKQENDHIYEIKEIAMTILYNTYNNDINNIFKCQIDLREAYRFIAEIYFLNCMSIKKGFDRLKIMTDKVQNSKNLADDINCISELDLNDVNENNKFIATQIVMLLQNRDIFWMTFYGLFSEVIVDPANKGNFNLIINEICNRIRLIVNKFEDSIENTELEDNIYRKYKYAIYQGIFEAFDNKISFFTNNKFIDEYQEKITYFIKQTQVKLNNVRIEDLDCCMDQVKDYVTCLVSLSNKGYIETKVVESLYNNNKNSMALGFELNADFMDKIESDNIQKISSDDWNKVFQNGKE